MQLNEFNNNYLEPLLQKAININKPVILAGDFNVNLLKYGTHSDTNDFVDTLHTIYFSPQILTPTRLTSQSSTLIDNIFLNTHNFITFSGNLTTSISDHLPQYLFIDNFFQTNPSTTKTIWKRDFRSFSMPHFKQDIKNLD